MDSRDEMSWQKPSPHRCGPVGPLLRLFISEDRGPGDITVAATLPDPDVPVVGSMRAHGPTVVAANGYGRAVN